MSEQDATQETSTDEQPAEENVDQEQQSPEDAGEGSDELEEVDLKEATSWDPERALKKIRKLNNEVRTAKERAKQTEDKANNATEEATTLRAQVAREKVARRLGLEDNEDTDEFLGRLKGDTVDDLMQDAERLLSLVAGSSKRPPSNRPTETLRGGGQPEREPEETDTRKIAERMFRV